MKLTLELPDTLESRLRHRQDHLVDILELGLSAFEDQSPTPEELVAYSRGELDPDTSVALRERLARDPEAVDDLLDLEHFEAPEPPTEDRRLDEDDVDRALADFRARLITAETTSPHRSEPTDSRGSKPDPSPLASWVDSRRPALRRTGPWLAVAAGLMLAIVGLWPWGGATGGTAIFGRPLAVETLRSQEELLSIPTTASQIQLVFSDIAPPVGRASRVVISSLTAGPILEQPLDPAGDTGSVLLVALDAELLSAGAYRVEIFDAASGESLIPAASFRVERRGGG